MNNATTAGRRPAHAAPRIRRALAISTAFVLCAVSTTAISQIEVGNDIEANFGAEYQATGFYVQSDSFQTPAATAANGQQLDSEANPADSENGFAQLFRLKADLKHKPTGISLKTSIQLTGDRFTGQNRPNSPTGDQAFNTNSTGDNVIVDLAYLDIPLKYGALRVGRQESNWSNCFLTCQDRRDRILGITHLGSPKGGITTFFAYDRTADIASFDNQGNGNEIFTGFVLPLAQTGFTLGLLYVHFFDNFNGNVADTNPAILPLGSVAGGTPTDVNNDGIADVLVANGSTGERPVNAQSNLSVFSPYVSGALGPVNISTGTNIFYGNNVVNNITPEDGDIFTDTSYAEYFRLGSHLGMFDLAAQYVGTQDGGFVDAGFDSFSSLINNNPDATQTATSVYSLGTNLGRKGFDENLYIGRVRANVTEKAYVSGAFGFLDINVPNSAAVNGKTSDTSPVVDVQAGYQFNDVMRTWATLGMIGENKVGTLTGNGLIGTIPNGGSFAAERVVAGSINLGVDF